MRVDRINYSKLLPTGVYSNERIGLDAELEPGDDAEVCLNKLRDCVEKLHKANNPQYYQDTNPIEVATTKDSKESATERIIAAINSCTEPKVLETFRLLVKSNPIFQEFYNKKENELASNQIQGK